MFRGEAWSVIASQAALSKTTLKENVELCSVRRIVVLPRDRGEVGRGSFAGDHAKGKVTSTGKIAAAESPPRRTREKLARVGIFVPCNKLSRTPSHHRECSRQMSGVCRGLQHVLMACFQSKQYTSGWEDSQESQESRTCFSTTTTRAWRNSNKIAGLLSTVLAQGSD